MDREIHLVHETRYLFNSNGRRAVSVDGYSMKTSLILLVLQLACAFLNAQTPVLSDADIDSQAVIILHKLTLEQKLQLLGGQDRKYIRGIPEAGIPKVRMSDGPFGVGSTVIGGRPSLPANNYAAGIALAASWDTDLARLVGESLGKDARARGVGILLAPGVNLYRSPLNGRNFEYFGEDPFLATEIAVPYIEGIQSQGVIATIKHLVANNSEYDRHNTDAVVEEQALHELYLPAFEAAVKDAHVGAIMDSYNSLNGVHLTENCPINVDLLRKRWGFQGILMSDWDATYDGVRAAQCGLDIEMPFAKYMTVSTLRDALQKEKITEGTIDEKILHILRTEIRFGLLDRNKRDLDIPVYGNIAHDIALRSSLESIVLLKNRGNLLPLSSSNIKTLAVIGPDAYPAVPGGGGSSSVVSFSPKSFLTGIADYLGDKTRVLYQPGLPALQAIFAETTFDGNDPAKSLTFEEFDNPEYAGLPIRQSVDAHIDQWHQETWAPPQTSRRYLRWKGSYTPKTTGDYILLAGAFSADTYDALIDGKYLMSQPEREGQAPQFRIVHLTEKHPIQVEIRYHPGNSTLRMGFGIRGVQNLILPEALEVAQNADAVVLFVGFDSTTEGEGYDRSFSLPWGQDALIRAVATENKNVIVDLTAGGGVDVKSWINQVPVLLHSWYLGQEAGDAMAKVIFGEVSPEGRLPITLDKSWEDNPTHNSYYASGSSNDVAYKEGLFLGYRYYASAQMQPLYPFGYGLTYTAFDLNNMTVENSSKMNVIKVSCDIANIGLRAGVDVVQLYVGLSVPDSRRPTKELKAFQKVRLQPKEVQHLTFTLNERALSYYDAGIHDWRRAYGKIRLYVGDSSTDTPLSAIVDDETQ
jgi:beta-glucosidase